MAGVIFCSTPDTAQGSPVGRWQHYRRATAKGKPPAILGVRGRISHDVTTREVTTRRKLHLSTSTAAKVGLSGPVAISEVRRPAKHVCAEKWLHWMCASAQHTLSRLDGSAQRDLLGVMQAATDDDWPPSLEPLT
jgi:hypothetical protein